jgi:hypothetical protein
MNAIQLHEKRTFAGTLPRTLSLTLSALLVVAATLSLPAADEPTQIPIEVHEWSIWVGNPAQTSLNTSKIYRDAMPNVVGTQRPKAEEKDLAAKFPVAPVSVVQFYGTPTKDVDIDIKAKKGPFLAHWPKGTERGERIQYFKSNLSAAPPANIPASYLPLNHWFQKLRDNPGTLYLTHENLYERFLTYDAELNMPVPIRIRGGPDEYTIQNMTNRKLLDVAVIAPGETGFRVGWLDELPTAGPEKSDEKPAKKGEKDKVDSVLKEAEKKTEEEEIPPLPAEGDPGVRARVDQVLNRNVVVNANQTPAREVLNMITGQVRLRYDLDDKTIAKADIDMNKQVTLNSTNVAARDAMAELLGTLALSYRVTEDGKLFITTSVRLAEEGNKKGNTVEGPPIKMGMSLPLKPDNPSYKEMTHDTLSRRLAAQGLREDQIQLLLGEYGKLIFEPGELIVLVHYSRAAIDETVLLDVFPQPKKFVRTAMLVVHGVDPRLQDRARALVKQLGDKSYKTREQAETKLTEMGPVAVPALEDALIEKDVEIVFRAERLLLRLNRSVP